MTRQIQHLITLLSLPLLGACSGETIDVIGGKPVIPDAPSSTTISSEATLAGVVASSSQLLVGSDVGLLAVTETSLAPVELIVSAEDPADSGAVLALSPRGEGALVAAANGIYYSHGERLLRSPASEALANVAVHSLDHVADDGAGERSWFGSRASVYRWKGEALSRWEIDSDAAVHALAESGGLVLAAAGDALFVIDPTEGGADTIDHPFGRVAQIVRGAGGTFYLATASGAVVRHADGSFSQYTLSDSDAAVAVSAVDYDSFGGAVFASDIGIVRLQGDLAGLAPPADDAQGLAIDFFGDVWLSSGDTLTGLYVGEPVSFAGSIAPLVGDHCNSCHSGDSNGAPIIDFSDHQTAVDWADRIVARVTDPLNPMPPANASPLAHDGVEAIVRWYATGTAP